MLAIQKVEHQEDPDASQEVKEPIVTTQESHNRKENYLWQMIKQEAIQVPV